MDVALPPDMPPGMGALTAPRVERAVTTTLDECGQYRTTLVATIQSAIESCLHDCGNNADHCHSCIAGRVTLALNSAEATHGKCSTKIVNEIRGNLGEAYWYAERFVGPVPSPEELQAWANGGIVSPPPDTSASSLGGPGDVSAVSLPPVVQPGGGNPPPKLPPILGCPPGYIYAGDHCVPWPQTCCNPDGTPTGLCPPGLQCPHGTQPPPAPPPPTQPPPFECPPGQIQWFNALLQQWECLPGHGCPPGETASVDPVSGMLVCKPTIVPVCNIIPPTPTPAPPPGPVPPCPAPTEPCPDGQSWQYVDNAWQCLTTPPPPPPPPSGTCADVTAVECAGTVGKVWDMLWPEWNSKECPDFSTWQQHYTAVQGLTTDGAADIMRKHLGLKDEQGNWQYPQWIKQIVSALPTGIQLPSSLGVVVTGAVGGSSALLLDIQGTVASGLLGIEDALACYLPAAIYSNIPRYESCDPAPAAIPWLLRFVVAFAEEWLGEGVSELRETLSYQVDYWCPSQLIGVGETHELYATGRISEETWRCWMRANNQMDKQQELVADMRTHVFSVRESLQAYTRGLITPQELQQRITWNKIKSQQDQGLAIALEAPLPTLAEAARWTRTGTITDAAASRYGLDAGQEALQNDPVKMWVSSSLATGDHIKDEWRAGWRTPGVQELAQMTFRLRDDSLNADNQALTLDQEDIDYIYRANGISEFWKDRLMAIARPAIGLRQLHLLIRFSGLPDDALLSHLLDEGWSEDDANELKEVLTSAEQDRLFRELSVLNPHDIGRTYAEGFISQQEASDQITQLGYSEDQASVTIGQADFLRAVGQRREVVKVVELNYKGGAIDGPAAVALMVNAGIPQDQALLLVQQWEQRKQSHGKPGKEAGASELCTWFGQGIITGDEYYTRLIGLGWSPEDAIKIVTSCGIKISSKLARGSKPAGSPKPQKPRELTVAELCKLQQQGLIDDTFYYDHMLKLGFSGDDATLLLKSCEQRKGATAAKPPSGNGAPPPAIAPPGGPPR